MNMEIAKTFVFSWLKQRFLSNNPKSKLQPKQEIT